MQALLLTLAGPRASFGSEAAIGDRRDTHDAPSRSALLGMIGAAMGIRRDERERLAEIAGRFAFVARVDRAGALETDFHTAQVAKRTDLKGRAVRMRGDELDVPRDSLTTVISQRSYRCDFHATIAVLVATNAADAARMLEKLAGALRQPRWPLYLGRKACALGWPLDPRIIEAADLEDLFATYDGDCARNINANWPKSLVVNRRHVPALRSALPGLRRVERVFVADEALKAIVPGTAGGLRVVVRRDVPTDRNQWLFANQSRFVWNQAAEKANDNT